MHNFNSISSFLRGSSGSVATTFGLSFIPAILMAGAAVDYSRSVTQWSNLQQATDATALSVAHTYLTSTSTAASLQTFAQNYINGLMGGATIASVTLKQANTVVCVKSNFIVPTVFMKIASYASMPVSANSCSQVGNTYEVAVALDNSSSMSETDSGGVSKSTLENAIALTNGRSWRDAAR